MKELKLFLALVRNFLVVYQYLVQMFLPVKLDGRIFRLVSVGKK